VIATAKFPRERFGDVQLLKGLSDDVYNNFSAKRIGDKVVNLWDGLLECTFAAGETILREGDYCDGAYYVIDGAVEVRFEPGPRSPRPVPGPSRKLRRFARLLGRSSAATPRVAGDAEGTVVLADVPVDLPPGGRTVLVAGELFGEGSALSRYPIATDILAESDVRCLLIRTPLLREMFEEPVEPAFAQFKTFFNERYRERTLRAHLRRVPVFQMLDATAIAKIAERAELVSVKRKATIAREGEPIDALYLVRGGYIKVSVRTRAADVAATYLRSGDVAGEAGLLLGEPWPFTLTALDHVELVKVPSEIVREIADSSPDVERYLWARTTSTLKQRNRAAVDPAFAEPLQFAMLSGLVHGDSVLLIDLERCTRCDECVRACADTHAGVPKFIREGDRFRNFSVPTACYHCLDPVCMIGCPTGAISRPLGTSEVVIDARTCIGCQNCVNRCPWDNIQTVPYDSPATGTRIDLASKCDLCIGREDGPACVQMCPHGATIRVNYGDSERISELLGL
jgi:Fe-S-cluster-containing hydrogenase component 2/CRP-like cAMP-binding protein